MLTKLMMKPTHPLTHIQTNTHTQTDIHAYTGNYTDTQFHIPPSPLPPEDLEMTTIWPMPKLVVSLMYPR